MKPTTQELKKQALFFTKKFFKDGLTKDEVLEYDRIIKLIARRKNGSKS